MTNDQLAMTDCIYCCARSPSSREHVLQYALGGNLTAPVACVTCNQSFSRIDQALAEQSIVAMERAVRTPASRPVRLGNLHFMYRAEVDLWEEVQITNKLAPRIPPQLHFRDPHVWFFAGRDDDRQRLVDLVDRLVEVGKLAAVPIRVGPERYCTTARLVQHRPKELLIRARTQEDGETFRSLLPKLWAQVRDGVRNEKSLEKIDTPTINMHLAICLDDIYRAVAKSAFNLLALRKGIEFARRPEFDLIRNYIRGLDIRHPAQTNADGVAVDRRFVSEDRRGESFLFPTKQHLIILGYSYPMVFAAVTLYGKHTFLVRFGELQLQSLYDFLPEAHEFSIDGTSNHAIDMFEMERRIHETRHPQEAGF